MKRHLLAAAAMTLIASTAVACGSDDDLAIDASAVDSATNDSATNDSATNDSATNEIADDTVVFIWSETGGCAMAGPNCARYEVTANGTVTTYRENEAEAAASGSIDTTLVNEWLAQLKATDAETLTDQLGPGELTAAFDGVDNTLRAPHRGVELSSVDYEFDSALPFFAAAEAVLSAAQEAAPLEIEMRE